jgi:hypothetical protein
MLNDSADSLESNLSTSFTLNGNGKRSASPMDYDGSKKHKPGICKLPFLFESGSP